MSDLATARETVAIKLVVTGPFAAGKTTMVRTMSEIPVVGTETVVTDGTAEIKGNTTVSMDFGKLTLADADLCVEVSLFGTPGQARFSFMWDVLAQGMDGFVVLVDAARAGGGEYLAETAEILAHFRGLADVPFVIGANRDGDLDGLAERLGAPGATVIPCDARDQESARTVLVTLLEAVLDAVEEEAA